MKTEIVLAYLHFVALIGTASLLVVEVVLLSPAIRGAALHRLRKVDGAYGAFAMAALATGAMRVAFGAKGSAYYLANPIFHTKVALFVAVALLSIMPTVRFTRWSKAALQQADHAPPPAEVASVRRFLRLQLAGLAAIPLFATLMAHGVSRLG